MSDLAWQKSSFSGGAQDNCIEVAGAAAALHLRESEDPDVVIAPGREALRALLTHIKACSSIA